MNGFEKRKERLKNDILKTARNLFSTRGYNKVSIQEIAETAQVSPMSIYNFFTNKESLLKSVLEEMVTDNFEHQASALNSSRMTKTAIENYLIAKTKLKTKAESCFFDQMIVQYDDLHHVYMTKQNIIEDQLHRIIAKGQETHILTTQATPQQIRILIDSMAQTYPCSSAVPSATQMPIKLLFNILWHGMKDNYKT